MSILIVEGPDGSGKTTLCHRLANRYGAKVFHTGPPCRDAFMEYMTDAVRYSELPTVVLDRFHLGTFVYGNIFRGKPDLGYRQWKQLEAFLESIETAIVLLTTTPTIIRENLSKKASETGRSEYEGIETISNVISHFYAAYERSDLPKMKVDPFSTRAGIKLESGDTVDGLLHTFVEGTLGWS